ncbi:MAG TPA: cell division protein FtsA [Candidatus Binataceae bacterium]|nr:cell division protein FtsA [Candidatus Binataceae bacterium]
MRNVLTALDVGTSKVCALVAEPLPEGGGATVLGYGVAPCTGLRKGVVVNIEATVEAIRAAVSEAERTAGVRVGAAVVGEAGAHIRGLNSHGIVAVRGGEVSARDVERVIDAARAVAIPLDRQVLHILPQQFAVDDQEGVRDPIGMAGVRLEARIHIVTAAQSYGQNLTKCCERANITPLEIVFEPLASADAALFPEERELGVALLDIGGGTTDIVVFHGGAAMHTAVLPLGGNHLTGDVAAGLRTPLNEAERLKTTYGVATNSVVGRDQTVQVPGVGGREPRVIARRILGEIIEPRMEEIFTMAQREVMRSGVADSLASGLVLVGGSSLLEGTQELAERIFALPVRRGLPINLRGMPEELMKPAYTTAAGLLLHAAGANGAVSNGAMRGGRLGKLRSLVSDWMRDFF